MSPDHENLKIYSYRPAFVKPCHAIPCYVTAEISRPKLAHDKVTERPVEPEKRPQIDLNYCRQLHGTTATVHFTCVHCKGLSNPCLT